MSDLQLINEELRLEVKGDELILTLAAQGIQGPPGTAVPGTGASYSQTFTQANLSIAGVLVVTHNLNSYPSGIAIYNSSGESIVPDRGEITSLNTCAIYLESFAPLAGTWRICLT